MWYSFALLVHILGAVGLFSSVSLVITAFVRMRQAPTLEQIREWVAVAQFAGKSLMSIGLVILAPALYMVSVAWGFTTPWVLAALLNFVVLAIIGGAVSGGTIQRVSALVQTAPPGQVPDTVRTHLLARRLWLAEGIRVMLLVGMVCLMTLKPDLRLSLLILLGAVFVGLLLGLLLDTITQRSLGRRVRKEQLV
ncbi:MAG: hypothetical protein ACXVCO_18760 [Ktedonobacterales bacterium]